jgi:hypothetical protein
LCSPPILTEEVEQPLCEYLRTLFSDPVSGAFENATANVSGDRSHDAQNCLTEETATKG